VKELQARDHPHDKWRFHDIIKDDNEALAIEKHIKESEESWRWRLTDIPDIFKKCTESDEYEVPKIVRSGRYNDKITSGENRKGARHEQ